MGTPAVGSRREHQSLCVEVRRGTGIEGLHRVDDVGVTRTAAE